MKYVKKIKLLIVMIFTLSATLVPGAALALNTQNSIQCGINGAAGASGCAASPSTSLSDTVATVINILSAVAGIAAVIMIIIAGLRYITSAGSPEAAKGARNTILYAIIGLVIVALAQIIVHFVIHNATNGTKKTGEAPSRISNVSDQA